MSIKIVVVDRGWVFVGKVFKDDESLLLKNAYIIRRWGTTKGLGQLCIEGKLSDTILDKCIDIEIPIKSVIVIFDCDETKWNNIL